MKTKTLLVAVLGTVLAPVLASADDTVVGSATLGTPMADAATGTTPISVDTLTGEARASIPIDVPLARGSVQLGLALDYNSTSGIREAGVGWGLRIPSIERRNISGGPQYQDPFAGQLLDPKKADRFVFDGQELVPICLLGTSGCLGDSGQAPAWAGKGWTYFRLHNDQLFARFFWSPDHLTWRVQLKSGELMELGAPLANNGDTSGLVFDSGAGTGKIFRWNVVGRYDPQSGNSVNGIVYKWAKQESGFDLTYLTDVYDTPPPGTAPFTSPLDTFAHHLHITWEPGAPSYPTLVTPPWRAAPRYRIQRIDVASKNFDATATDTIRSYLLGYASPSPLPGMSFLASVQEQGWCGSEACRLPATQMTYSVGDAGHPAIVTPQGYHFRLPDTGPSDVVLIDANGDGLLDFAQPPPSSPPQYTHTGDLYLNQFSGGAYTLAHNFVAYPSGTGQPILSTNNYSVTVLGDWGNGRVDAQFWPDLATDTWGYFHLAPGTPPNWQWYTVTAYVAPWQVYQGDYLVDVDADGLVDDLYHDGDLRFSRRVLDDGKGRPPYVEGYTEFHEASFEVPSGTYRAAADMDGDGLVDLVYYTAQSAAYLPGDGAGNFKMSNSRTVSGLPPLAPTNGEKVYFHDVTGDGRADVITLIPLNAQSSSTATNGGWVVVFPGVTVYPSIDGTRFGGPLVVSPDQIPDWNDTYAKLQFGDLNGSGVDDVVVIAGTSATFLDFARPTNWTQVQRPGLLTRITNGRGLTSDITYDTTTSLGSQTGIGWSTFSPQLAQVVTNVFTYDATTSAQGERHQTAYVYKDPVYDGWRRRLRGFRSVKTLRGTATSTTAPTTEEVTYFFHDCAGLSPTAACYDDDPLEIVQGAPVLAESSSPNTGYLSTRHTQYHVQQIANGLDGRHVWSAYHSQDDTLVYDSSSGPATALITVQDVVADAGITVPDPMQIPARYRSYSHLRTETTADSLGNVTAFTDRGKIDDSGSAIDPVIAATYGWQFAGAEASWINRQTSVAIGTRTVSYLYDASGNVTDVNAVLSGTEPLDRHHETGAPTAPTPTTASKDGTKNTHFDYDGRYGNVIRRTSPAHRTVVFGYDTKFQQLPTTTTVSSGLPGTFGMETIRVFDRGLGAVTITMDPNNAVSMVSYDALGRVQFVQEPGPDAGFPNPAANVSVTYYTDVIPNRARIFVEDGPGVFHARWVYADGFGRTLLSIQEADPDAGDAAQWIVAGLPDRDVDGRVTRTYLPWFYGGDPGAYPFSGAHVGAPDHYITYDNAGRVTAVANADGVTIAKRAYHGLSTDSFDASDVARNGSTKKTASVDGHGRLVSTIATTTSDAIEDDVTYAATGEILTITQKHTAGSDKELRQMFYDSLGRLVQNYEPNTHNALRAWTYAYDDDGYLVGTSDARGCGENRTYDGIGRLLAEDYSPCLASQPAWTQPDLTTGDGTEAFYRYDATESDDHASFALGRLASVSDRGAHTRYYYDSRGRTTNVERQIVRPGDAATALADRYAPSWYQIESEYDERGRPTRASTGADAPGLFGDDGTSELRITYTARGALKALNSSYGPLVASEIRAADGALVTRILGDLAGTTQTYGYDDMRRVSVSVVTRNAPTLWQSSSSGYSQPGADTTQLTLESYGYKYTADDDSLEIDDLRDASAWGSGYKPVNRTVAYDDLHRVTSIVYANGGDAQKPTLLGTDGNSVPKTTLATRVQSQSFTYDWRGNLTSSDDDQHAFYDRSLGVSAFDVDHPDRLTSAQRSTCSFLGCVIKDRALALYDDAGDMTALQVTRSRACNDPNGRCSPRFQYDWDEVGQLVRARRWDFVHSSDGPWPGVPTTTAVVDLKYAYSQGARVLKTVTASDGVTQSFTAEIFGSLRLNHAAFTNGDYQHDDTTETVYLAGVARVIYAQQDLPTLTSGRRHVFLELGDHLGSSSIVIDKDTGELVERATYTGYGATDSDERPDRWGDFREDYRFTGKEEDIEVGLTYFGARYYNVALGRFISPDPLTIHSFGPDLNPYAYVGGRVMTSVDPLGLCDGGEEDGKCTDGSRPGQPTGGHIDDGGFGNAVKDIVTGAASGVADVATSAWDRTAGKFFDWLGGLGKSGPPPRPPCAYCGVKGDPAGICDPHSVEGAIGTAAAQTFHAWSVSHEGAKDALLDMVKGQIQATTGGNSLANAGFDQMFNPLMADASMQDEAGYKYGYWATTIGAMLAPGGGEDAAAARAIEELPTLVIDSERMPAIAENIRNALAAGRPDVLVRGAGEAAADANRAAALAEIKNVHIPGFSPDEYPFASTVQGGGGSWIGHVPIREQRIQGGVINAFYTKFGIRVGDRFRVVVR